MGRTTYPSQSGRFTEHSITTLLRLRERVVFVCGWVLTGLSISTFIALWIHDNKFSRKYSRDETNVWNILTTRVPLKHGEYKMNNMLVAIFDTAPQAYEGLNALKELHSGGDITLYLTSVIAKDASGTVRIKQSSKRKPAGAPLGLLAGSLLGLLGGSMGAFSGLPYDLVKAGGSDDFFELVSQALEPGKVALLAEIDETSVTPVDTKLVKLGGHVFRRPCSEFVDDQIAQDLKSPVYTELMPPGPQTSIYLH
jgi:uncharacterized membrane protein